MLHFPFLQTPVLRVLLVPPLTSLPVPVGTGTRISSSFVYC